MDELLKAAYHEAGHAFGCLYYGFDFAKVTVEPDDVGLGGLVDFELPPFAPFELQMQGPRSRAGKKYERAIVVGLLGQGAEDQFCGREPGRCIGREDRRLISWLVSCLVVSEREEKALMLRLRWQVWILVRNPQVWAAIGRLALPLREYSTLDAWKCSELMSEAITKCRRWLGQR